MIKDRHILKDEEKTGIIVLYLYKKKVRAERTKDPETTSKGPTLILGQYIPR